MAGDRNTGRPGSSRRQFLFGGAAAGVGAATALGAEFALSQATAPLEGWFGAPLTLQRILGWVFTPLAWLLGLEASDLSQAGQLLGQRILLTEVVAYQKLGEMAAAESLSPRTMLVLSYALCGFAHLASVGIFVGGITALVPSRRDDLAALALTFAA